MYSSYSSHVSLNFPSFFHLVAFEKKTFFLRLLFNKINFLDNPPPEVTLRGTEYITYDLQQKFLEPILSINDEISLHFKTRKSSGLLFYTGNYVWLTIIIIKCLFMKNFLLHTLLCIVSFTSQFEEKYTTQLHNLRRMQKGQIEKFPVAVSMNFALNASFLFLGVTC